MPLYSTYKFFKLRENLTKIQYFVFEGKNKNIKKKNYIIALTPKYIEFWSRLDLIFLDWYVEFKNIVNLHLTLILKYYCSAVEVEARGLEWQGSVQGLVSSWPSPDTAARL